MTQIKDSATQLPWIRYDRNPYGVPLLDLRPITFQLASDVGEIALKHLDSYSLEDGATFSGLLPGESPENRGNDENNGDTDKSNMDKRDTDQDDGHFGSLIEPVSVETIRRVPCELSYETVEKLYPGSLFVPQTPEDRWAIFFDGGYIYFVRSWSRQLVARAKVELTPHQLLITEIEGAILEEFETENQTIALVNFLMLSHVLGESAPVPLLNELESDPNRAAVWAFAFCGHKAKVGVFAEDAIFPAQGGIIRSTTAYHIAIANDDKESVKLILSQNWVDPNVIAQDGFTPIHWALYTDHFEMMELLADNGVDINAYSLSQTTPLMDAVELRSEKGVHTLLTLGADPLLEDQLGFTALHRASAMGELNIAKALLLAGSDPYQANKAGITAIDLAKEKGNSAMVALLSEQA
ncbi:hypothetical protein DC083_09160 [Ignatzschineria ureiclastica]|uniref:Uncharacterized protein n=1 Tax=Ignatzschineria ureiclastica TaxID=472582 RepID=A0A2U2ACT5_9GAMM|nr:ankyrin repeat domain-containing protein [Ignatzschineria ureiclastica]PWD80468.1 hypothetical protein DC083_09160 [Ignatzschineria ureiclastica]GGZ99261.1 hypothetical protein GCM10007162_14220 [Ignatzschineria ureiclastica]